MNDQDQTPVVDENKTQAKLAKKPFQKQKKTEQTESTEKKPSVKPVDFCSDHFQLHTNHFDFTRAEVLTVRKMIHRKYPVTMHGFVDNVRELMASIQQQVKSKLYYEAELVYSNDGSRYRVSEVLYSVLSDEQKSNGSSPSTLIAIQPMSRGQRTAIRSNQLTGIPNGTENIMTLLNSVIDGSSNFSSTKSTVMDVSFKDLAQKLMTFFEKVKKDAVVFAFNLSVTDGIPRIYLEVGHAQSQSHSLTLDFELAFE